MASWSAGDKGWPRYASAPSRRRTVCASGWSATTGAGDWACVTTANPTTITGHGETRIKMLWNRALISLRTGRRFPPRSGRDRRPRARGHSSMPALEHNGVRLSYDVTGTGAPVIFVQGVGIHGGGWRPQVDALQERFTCLTFDNRGIGRSSPVRRLTVEQMASDVVGLMEACGWAD